MQINGSAFQHGITGFTTSQANLGEASNSVAQASMTGAHNTNTASIQDGLVAATSSKLDAQANAKVLETANKTLGTIIDITA